MDVLPKQVRLLGFWGATSKAQYLEHIGESAAVSRLGDKNCAAQEENEEGNPKAHGGNDVAELKAEILLDIGYTSQWQDGTEVNAPVEPIEESACGFRSSVFYLLDNKNKASFLHVWYTGLHKS